MYVTVASRPERMRGAREAIRAPQTSSQTPRPIGRINSAGTRFQLGSLWYETSLDLMHGFAFLCDATTYSI